MNVDFILLLGGVPLVAFSLGTIYVIYNVIYDGVIKGDRKVDLYDLFDTVKIYDFTDKD